MDLYLSINLSIYLYMFDLFQRRSLFGKVDGRQLMHIGIIVLCCISQALQQTFCESSIGDPGHSTTRWINATKGHGMFFLTLPSPAQGGQREPREESLVNGCPWGVLGAQRRHGNHRYVEAIAIGVAA